MLAAQAAQAAMQPPQEPKQGPTPQKPENMTDQRRLMDGNPQVNTAA